MNRLSLRLVAICVASIQSCLDVQASDLVGFGSNWSYLHSVEGLDGDPAGIDDDFVTTWFQPNYDTTTPIKWANPAPEPFAYGDPGLGGEPNGIHIEAFMPTSPDFVREAGTFLTQPPTGSRYTAYFRHRFTTTKEASDLGIEFVADDGNKVYLDGRELLAFNCCEFAGFGQPANYAELASAIGPEDYLIGRLPNLDVLPAGEHVLAVEVHQGNTASSDLGFSMRIFDGYVREEYVASGSTWKYFEGTAEPSAGTLDWSTAGFDDASWKSGPDGFGYERDPNRPTDTVVPLLGTPLPDMEGNYSTLYLRRDFAVPEPSAIDRLFLEVDYDDGFFAYINGTLVASSVPDPDGDPLTPIPADALGQDLQMDHESTNADGNPGDSFFIDVSDFPGLLKTGGDNVLAIQGVNRDPSSEFLLAQLVLTGFGERGGSVGVPGDFDGNGALDVADINALSAEVRGGGNNRLFDINSDNFVNDVDRKVWIENLKRTYFGDANLDGEFNTRDFVAVFVAGEYEDAVDGNSNWEEGDWNGDGDFSSRDFVAAFIGGGFEIGPRPTVAPVPEPSAGCLLLIAMCVGLSRRRMRK